MKILVFGSTGLIGKKLVIELLKKGHTVIGTSREAQKQDFASNNYTHYKVDVTKPGDFIQLPADINWVFNTSGYVPKSKTVDESKTCMMINALGVQNILEYMIDRKIKRLIHSSSVTVYGIPPKVYATEDTPLHPVISYGVSKVAAENFCTMYEKLCGLEITMLRYSPIYGADLRQQTAFTIFVEKARNNENITLFQKGERFQDYVSVDDTVQANILAAEKNIRGIFNIASGQVSSMKKLAQTIIKTFGSSSSIDYDISQQEEFSIGIDIARAKIDLGYRPKFSIITGLRAYKDSLEG